MPNILLVVEVNHIENHDSHAKPRITQQATNTPKAAHIFFNKGMT